LLTADKIQAQTSRPNNWDWRLSPLIMKRNFTK